jgi:hypothetical protein
MKGHDVPTSSALPLNTATHLLTALYLLQELLIGWEDFNPKLLASCLRRANEARESGQLDIDIEGLRLLISFASQVTSPTWPIPHLPTLLHSLLNGTFA